MSSYSQWFVSKELGTLKGRALDRIDINVPVVDGKISGNNLRLKAFARHADTYTENGIQVVMLSHQGREGDSDYLESLDQHAKALNAFTKKTEVVYSDSLGGRETEEAVEKLRPGQALLLKNVRSDPDEKRKFASQEEQRNSDLVRRLSKIVRFYINDATATMHRTDTSLVGFFGELPSYLGLQMEEELNVLHEMRRELGSGKRVVIIFGGSKWEKFENIYTIMSKNKNVQALCGGRPGQTLSYAQNKEHFNKENEQSILKAGGLDTAVKLLQEFPERILYPTDFILDSRENVRVEALSGKTGIIMDIGEDTLGRFFDAMAPADAIFYAGPVGVYELDFNQTTRLVTRFMGLKAHNYTLGGNSSDSMDDIGLNVAYEKLGGKRITSGGSALEFLADKEPAVLRTLSELKPIIRRV